MTLKARGRALLVTMLAVLSALFGAATTTASAATFIYDVSTTALVEAHEFDDAAENLGGLRHREGRVSFALRRG